jgi:PAS domain S-box-containing protein
MSKCLCAICWYHGDARNFVEVCFSYSNGVRGYIWVTRREFRGAGPVAAQLEPASREASGPRRRSAHFNITMPIRDLLRAKGLIAEPMVLVSTDGTIDTSNQPFGDEIGVPAQALSGRRLDGLAVASAAAIQEYLRACAASAEVVEGSLLLRRRAETIVLEARGIAYPPESAPSASQVLLRLVAEQRSHSSPGQSVKRQDLARWREIEDSLRRQSQILEVTLASIGDAVLVTDVNGRVTFLNPVAERLTGWAASAAKGRSLTEVFPIVNEQTRVPAENPVTKVLQTGVVVGLANRTVLLARNGREVPIADSAAPIRLPDGTMFGVVLIFRDITEERRAEHARAWLAAIVDSSHDAIVSKTLDGCITSWNPGATRLFGYEPEDIIGKPITTIVPPELYLEEEGVLARLRRGEVVDHFETVRVRKDGRRIDVSLTVSPIRNEHGEIIGASKSARDISERKQTERQLHEADRRKDEFLATLAHELRNPLAPLRNSVELLLRLAPDGAELQTACNIIDRQVHQMTHLVDDLLDLSRVRKGRIDLLTENVDLGALLQALEQSLRPAFEAMGQQITLALPAHPIYVRGDRARLVQVFSNILTNASKYTPPGGHIRIELESSEGDGVVRVRDTGIGIPADMLDEVFQLFAQVNRSSQLTRGGLGIGLAVAKRLIELHGGSIEARSAGEGQGSEFILRLPRSLQPAPSAEHLTRPLVAGPPRRILIADDNEDAAKSLSLLLEMLGHETHVVHDGLAAVSAVESFKPDVVILDIDMPKVDGFEAARRIARLPGGDAILRIALTGWAQEADRERVRAAGFHHHVVKPAQAELLAELIAPGRLGQS